MPKKIIAANWKMNNDEYSSKKLTFDFLKHLSKSNNENVLKILAVPFPFLNTVSKMCDGVDSVKVASQNCSSYDMGAYTGEVSANMLSSISINFSLVGHSERREIFMEKDEDILDKVRLLLENKISPIFCCGESINARKKGMHLDHIEKQMRNSIFKLDASEFKKLVIAYEPIWAIGTGETASINDIDEMHNHIRNLIKSNYSSSLSNSISLLYGGSVKPNNAKEIFDIKNVNGGLIGGASLNAKDFIDIVNSIN
ncbi:MAG: triose-phosphate isomerase [Flammeovirgaceae bacterium]|nr:triose-phosphate isomerase [Flammeovirgaceae bacterium]|tara:strand:- start:641 stop:1405 length:765 start_codon:yes stop_codon:yes gene_type:complete